jgi:predicted RNase H-like HicB family nuclease
LCPELDITSQGSSVEEARQNLKEAVELFLEDPSSSEAKKRFRSELFITQLEVVVG